MESEQTKAAESAPNPQSQPSEPVKLLTVSDIATGEPSEASPHVVGLGQDPTPATAPEPEREIPLEEIRDADGKKFDPEKHSLGPDGKPVLTPKGYFSQRKAKAPKPTIRERIDSFFRKPGPEAEPEPKPVFRDGSALPSPDVLHPGEPEPEPHCDAQAAAAQTVAMEEMLAVMTIGEEWQFLSTEKQALVKAWTRVYEKTGVSEMPIWMEIVAAHAVLITARAKQPKTQEKLGSLKNWLTKKYLDLRNSRKKAHRAPAKRDLESKPSTPEENE